MGKKEMLQQTKIPPNNHDRFISLMTGSSTHKCFF